MKWLGSKKLSNNLENKKVPVISFSLSSDTTVYRGFVLMNSYVFLQYNNLYIRVFRLTLDIYHFVSRAVLGVLEMIYKRR